MAMPAAPSSTPAAAAPTAEAVPASEPDEYAGLSTPAWQRRDSGRPQFGRAASRGDSLEIPTFLRRQMD